MQPLSTWLVRDAAGVEHRVQRDKGFFYGHENLVNHVDGPEKPYVMGKLLIAIDKSPDMGEFAGFTWIAE